MNNERLAGCNRCPLPNSHFDCNNLIKGNKCVAVEHPDFEKRCPFYKPIGETKAKDAKYHQIELPGVEVWGG